MHMPANRAEVGDAELAQAGAELDQARDKIIVSMTALECEITRTLDWREWVRRKPAIVLCLAFSLGLFVGRLD
jgi:hypothetical protein